MSGQIPVRVTILAIRFFIFLKSLLSVAFHLDTFMYALLYSVLQCTQHCGVNEAVTGVDPMLKNTGQGTWC